MSVFTSDKEIKSKQPLVQCAVSLKFWCICKGLWVVAYQSLETKEKSKLGNPKSGRGHLWELLQG